MDEAVALMVAGDALDPDYGTLWTERLVRQRRLQRRRGRDRRGRSRTTPGPSKPDDMTDEQAKLAVQQLVYTRPGHPAERVPGRWCRTARDPVPLFGIDTAGGLKAAKQLDVLAFMNVTTPEEGQTVSGTFTAQRRRQLVRGDRAWEVRDGSGASVLDGFTTAEGWIDQLYPWKTEVDVSGLAPGTYTFVAMTDDPSDGEGAGPTEDTKTITVS